MKIKHAVPTDVVASRSAMAATDNLDVVCGPLAPHPASFFFAGNLSRVDGIKGNELACRVLGRPVVLHQGMVLDGGDRLRAALARGVRPTFEHYEGDEAFAYAMTLAFGGPNYSKGQRAAGVAYVQDWSLAQTHGGIRTQVANLQLATCKERSERAGVSPRTQGDADKIAKADTGLLLSVFRGVVTLAAALKLVDKSEDVEADAKRDPHERCKAKYAALLSKFEAIHGGAAN